MRWPLRHQILWPLAGSMLVTLVAASMLTAYLQARQQEAEIAAQLDALSETLRRSNFPLTDHVLEQMRGLSGAEFLLANASGPRLATAGVASLLNRGMPQAAEPASAGRLGTTVTVADESYFHRVVNLGSRSATSPATTLHVFYPERSWREARGKAIQPALIVGAAAVGLATVLATVLARRWSRPIALLRRQIAGMAEGDYTGITLPRRNDELRDLVSSANALAAQLVSLTAAVRRSERLAVLGQLSGGMAHDLRNTVTGARMALQLHARSCAADDESLEVALRQMGLIEEYLRRFLVAGKPEQLQRARTDLGELIEEIVRLVEPACRHRRVRLEVELPSDSSPIWADAGQLRQLFLNLLLNGFEAAGAGGWVRVTMMQASTSARIRVVDSGPGLDPTIRDRLFEPFATTKPEGLGLGLAVARQVVEAHGGTIACIEYDGRTAFEVVLPVGNGDVSRQQQPIDGVLQT
ncbi:MAG: hypothetical protein K2Y37_07900 [Pirellulales bacterium]|nr:hypothetical protein [Pirellulales bacterium]